MLYKGQTVIVRSTSKDGQVAPWAETYYRLNGLKARIISGPDAGGFYDLTSKVYPHLQIRGIYLYAAHRGMEWLLEEEIF